MHVRSPERGPAMLWKQKGRHTVHIFLTTARTERMGFARSVANEPTLPNISWAPETKRKPGNRFFTLIFVPTNQKGRALRKQRTRTQRDGPTQGPNGNGLSAVRHTVWEGSVSIATPIRRPSACCDRWPEFSAIFQCLIYASIYSSLAYSLSLSPYLSHHFSIA